MQTTNRLNTNNGGWEAAHPVLWTGIKIAAGVMFLGGVLFLALMVAVMAFAPANSGISQFATWLLAGDKPQVTWYITRAAGITAYLLLWLSTAWGLAVSTRVLDGALHGAYTYDFHQFISLLAIGFLGLHIVVLLIDQYAPFSVVQILVPFLSSYRPGWVGLGVLSMYIILLVTVTFYLRNRIGSKTFRSIHVLSLLGFLGGAVHGLMSGTDSPLPTVQIMYGVTFLSVVFLMVYWLATLALRKRMAAAKTAVTRAPASKTQVNLPNTRS